MNEKQHLLSNEEQAGDEFETFDTAVTIEKTSELVSVTKTVKDHTQIILQLQERLNNELNKNVLLTSKLDLLTQKFDSFQSQYIFEMAKKNKEIEKLEHAFEARQELQNSVIDELKLQLQSLRKKVEKTIDVSSDPSKLIEFHDEISKKCLRKNSNDSTGSSCSSALILPRLSTVYRGETVWRINSFSKKLKKISAGTYDEPSRSEPFTAGTHGYRLSLWGYLNGRGKSSGKYLSLFIRVLASEVDAILPWPIKPCYTFCLASQDPDPSKRLDFVRIRDLSVKHKGISRPQKDDKSYIVGFDDFILHEELEKKNFLVDDTLFIKCNVEISQF